MLYQTFRIYVVWNLSSNTANLKRFPHGRHNRESGNGIWIPIQIKYSRPDPNTSKSHNLSSPLSGFLLVNFTLWRASLDLESHAKTLSSNPSSLRSDCWRQFLVLTACSTNKAKCHAPRQAQPPSVKGGFQDEVLFKSFLESMITSN